jgi:hypothetical protein
MVDTILPYHYVGVYISSIWTMRDSTSFNCSVSDILCVTIAKEVTENHRQQVKQQYSNLKPHAP